MIRLTLAGALALMIATTATAATQTATAKPAVTKSVQCKDAKGKFIKCPAPVAKAVVRSPVAVVSTKVAATKSVPAGGVFWDGGAEVFIHRGVNGRWKDTLTPEEIAEYEARAVQELGPECAHWLFTGERG